MTTYHIEINEIKLCGNNGFMQMFTILEIFLAFINFHVQQYYT